VQSALEKIYPQLLAAEPRVWAGEHRHQLRTEAAQMHKFCTYHSNRVRPWPVAQIGGSRALSHQ
jgi:hypothetical protein